MRPDPKSNMLPSDVPFSFFMYGVAVSISADLMCAGLQPGFIPLSTAAAPATCALEIEVPSSTTNC